MNILKCYKFCCYGMSKSSSKCPSVQVLTTCFYLTWRFFWKKKSGGLGLVSMSHFRHSFLRKIFLTLYAIKGLNLIDRLPLLLEILGNMFIIMTCFLSYQAIFLRPKRQDKSFFIIFKGLSVVRKYLRLRKGYLD